MTKQEAIQALNEGEKVRHRFFLDVEYICLGESGYLYDANGDTLGPEFWDLRTGEAWENGWSIVN